MRKSFRRQGDFLQGLIEEKLQAGTQRPEKPESKHQNGPGLDLAKVMCRTSRYGGLLSKERDGFR